jgi:hypothetical protein
MHAAYPMSNPLQRPVCGEYVGRLHPIYLESLTMADEGGPAKNFSLYKGARHIVVQRGNADRDCWRAMEHCDEVPFNFAPLVLMTADTSTLAMRLME